MLELGEARRQSEMQQEHGCVLQSHTKALWLQGTHSLQAVRAPWQEEVVWIEHLGKRAPVYQGQPSLHLGACFFPSIPLGFTISCTKPVLLTLNPEEGSVEWRGFIPA